MLLSKYIKSIRYKDTTFNAYILCAVIRVILVFVPQTGYIHPDEFFQSVEVFTGDEYDLEHTRTWEFNSSYPIRSVAIPYFTIKIPLNFLRFISIYARYYLGIELRSSYIFLIYPRLIMCILSFLNDLSLYKICRIHGLRYETRLFALASSFVMLVFSTRTFSNTLEMTLCSVLLYFVSDCMIHSNTVIYKTEILQSKYQTASTTTEKVKLYKLRAALPPHSFNRVIIMSTLCVVGVFNRPTFLIFGAPMVFFWMLRGMGSRTVTFIDFNFRMALFCIYAVPSIIFFILIDSMYYGYLTTGEIHTFEISINNFVFTPWNFIKYNLDPQQTAQHGLHPRYLHLFVSIPLLYNVLGVIAIVSFGKMLFRFLKGDYRNLPRSQSVVGLMTSAIFAPLFIMSYINHQEPRFILPLTLPIILLHAPKLDGLPLPYPFRTQHPLIKCLYAKFIPIKIYRRTILRFWYTVNILLTLFFGFVHQGGVYPLSAHFSNIMHAKSTTLNVHLITNHLYSFPLAFLNIPSSKTIHIDHKTRQKYRRSQQFWLDEMGSDDIAAILSLVTKIKKRYETISSKNIRKYQIYLAMPSSLCDDFDEFLYYQNASNVKFTHLRNFYPHLSTEALPNPARGYWKNNMWSVLGVYAQFSSFVHQFGLALYQYEDSIATDW